MSKKLAIIGHVDHKSTVLSATIVSALTSEFKPEPKTIQEVIEEEQSIKYNAPYVFQRIHTLEEYSTGQQNRREIRAQKRKQKLVK
jgi:translation elongation factor EF-Tu-like GTPase